VQNQFFDPGAKTLRDVIVASVKKPPKKAAPKQNITPRTTYPIIWNAIAKINRNPGRNMLPAIKKAGIAKRLHGGDRVASLMMVAIVTNVAMHGKKR